MENFSEILAAKAKVSPERMIGRTWDLATMAPLVAKHELQHPARKVVSIVGSNGKGTCAHLLSQNLLLAGEKVAMITSPHVLNYRERLLINGQMLSEAVWTEHFLIIGRECFSALSYYESIMLVALHLVKTQGVDALVLEAGLGGRLDAINTVDADVLLVTAINLEHTELLGSTLESILAEKIAVARQVTRVYADLPKLEETLAFWQKEIGFERPGSKQTHVPSMPGINPSLVALVSRILEDEFGWSMVGMAVPYRSQLLSDWPLVIDTAHNAPAVKFLCEQIAEGYGITKWNWYINLQSNRDISEFVDALMPFSDDIVFCPVPGLYTKADLPTALKSMPFLMPKQACDRFSGKPTVVCGSFRVLEVFMQACTRSPHILC